RDDDIRALMASGAAFSTDWLGSSPLHLAALYSHHSTMGVLLGCPNQGGQDPPPEGCTILNSANINAKDIPKMTALCGADVHCLSKFDNTPFNIAMATSNTELMILLQLLLAHRTASYYIIPAYNPVSLSELITTTTTTILLPKKTSQLLSSVKSEDAMAAESVETTVQHEVGDGGQRVIITVMDQYGNLQLAALGQQFIVTLQEQHMVALSANTITEEVVVEEPQQPRPTHRRKTDLTAIPISTNNNVSQ
uniref:Uncharacterized protein n=1 Tax=Lates calcarifer TaxID=8187 RepID=A0A4W6C6Z5_LATCA